MKHIESRDAGGLCEPQENISKDGPFVIHWQMGHDYPIVTLDEEVKHSGSKLLYRFVEPLILKPNIAVPEGEIAQHAWGTSGFDFSNSLDVLVRRVKERFGLDQYIPPGLGNTYHLWLASVPINPDQIPDPVIFEDLVLGGNNQIITGDGLPPNNTVHLVGAAPARVLRLLMSLAYQSDRYLSTESLIDQLYYDDPIVTLDKASFRNSLDLVVFRLRKQLPDGFTIDRKRNLIRFVKC